METEIINKAAVFPRLNAPAPEFEAPSTHGVLNLRHFRGRWLVFFSHPADFTPVCTTEFVAFARSHQQFQEINCDLLGLSVDSVYSHVAWLRNIEEQFGIQVHFPLIADLGLRVSNAYGMVDLNAQETSTVRGTFIIDPQGVLRAMIYYPMTTGRSVEEILRCVRALQTADDHSVATPEGWTPGEKAVVYPPFNAEEAAERQREYGDNCHDWYLCTTDLPEVKNKTKDRVA